MLVGTLLLWLWMLVGCTSPFAPAPTPSPSIGAVRTADIPFPSDARNIVSAEEHHPVIDQVLRTTSYTTQESFDVMTTYYQQLFRRLGWLPQLVGPGVAIPLKPGDLPFGEVGRGGDQPGDPVVIRNIVVSIRPCGTATCVTIQDSIYNTVALDGLN
jgi:hypothetical protein